MQRILMPEHKKLLDSIDMNSPTSIIIVGNCLGTFYTKQVVAEIKEKYGVSSFKDIDITKKSDIDKVLYSNKYKDKVIALKDIVFYKYNEDEGIEKIIKQLSQKCMACIVLDIQGNLEEWICDVNIRIKPPNASRVKYLVHLSEVLNVAYNKGDIVSYLDNGISYMEMIELVKSGIPLLQKEIETYMVLNQLQT